jgi:hypothetical protein
MADLKAGTTIGGTLVWTQGNFPLFPTGDTLLYKTYKIYSENDKPQADDNDFVSKARGGIYSGNINVPTIGISSNEGKGLGISLYNGGVPGGEPNYGLHFSKIENFGGHSTNTQIWATYFRHIASYPWIFRIDNNNVASISPTGVYTGPNVILTGSVTDSRHATTKSYVDGLITAANNNANTKVAKAGDTMTGPLTAPRVFVNNRATAANEVPQLSQVVEKGTVIDFLTF